MPDQYGNPTFQDMMALVRGFRDFRQGQVQDKIQATNLGVAETNQEIAKENLDTTRKEKAHTERVKGYQRSIIDAGGVADFKIDKNAEDYDPIAFQEAKMKQMGVRLDTLKNNAAFKQAKAEEIKNAINIAHNKVLDLTSQGDVDFLYGHNESGWKKYIAAIDAVDTTDDVVWDKVDYKTGKVTFRDKITKEEKTIKYPTTKERIQAMAQNYLPPDKFAATAGNIRKEAAKKNFQQQLNPEILRNSKGDIVERIVQYDLNNAALPPQVVYVDPDKDTLLTEAEVKRGGYKPLSRRKLEAEAREAEAQATARESEAKIKGVALEEATHPVTKYWNVNRNDPLSAHLVTGLDYTRYKYDTGDRLTKEIIKDNLPSIKAAVERMPDADTVQIQTMIDKIIETIRYMIQPREGSWQWENTP